jgi:hypothetical protein
MKPETMTAVSELRRIGEFYANCRIGEHTETLVSEIDRLSSLDVKLALVRISKWRFNVIRLAADDRGFWTGSIVYGPATHEQCAAWIEVELAGKRAAAKGLDAV